VGKIKIFRDILKIAFLSVIFALPINPTYAEVKPQIFSSNEMSMHKLKDLSFKSIMREFYEGKMGNLFLSDDEFLKGKPYVGYLESDGSMSNGIAFLYPIIEYYNSKNEKRYLAIIQKSRVDEIQGEKDLYFGSFDSQGSADLYLFKKENEVYELVSRNNPKNIITNKHSDSNYSLIDSNEFGGDFGQIGFNPEDLKKNITKLGADLQGSFVFEHANNHGYGTEILKVIQLNENNFISIHNFGVYEQEDGTKPENSPLGFHYKGEYKVIDNGNQYFPIEIKFTGDMPSEDGSKIVNAERTEIYNFNPIKNEYEKKLTN
jgi:hypothetical protein